MALGTREDGTIHKGVAVACGGETQDGKSMLEGSTTPKLLALPRNSLSLSLSRTELEHELRAAMAMNAPADERPVCWRLYSLDLAPGTMEHRGYK